MKMIQYSYLLDIGLVLSLLHLACPQAKALTEVMDAFHFSTQQAAENSWVAQERSETVILPDSLFEGLQFICDFRNDPMRSFWDRTVQFDASGHSSFELTLRIDRPEAIRNFSLYLKSGNGWYICNKPLHNRGLQKLHFEKSDFTQEGHPQGWDALDTIRISIWKEASAKAKLHLFSLSARSNELILIQAVDSAPNNAERRYSKKMRLLLGAWLHHYRIEYGSLREDQISLPALSHTKLLILCYNPNPPPELMKYLTEFIAQGGKLMIFYSSSDVLADLMGLRLGDYIQSENTGRWTSFSFINPTKWKVPTQIYQNSMNLRLVYPKKHSSNRVIAFWNNKKNQSTRDPAWIESKHGLWMTHILLEGDIEKKRRMLLGLLSKTLPNLWETAALTAISKAGKVGPHENILEASEQFRDLAKATFFQKEVQQKLDKAQYLYLNMHSLFDAQQYPQVVTHYDKLSTLLAETYSIVQKPSANELRGVWDHDGVGWYPGDWEQSAQTLKKHGFNAIFPNMLWGGLAHFPSPHLPESMTYKKYGDQLKACIHAAHQHDIKVHLWIVCWNLSTAPKTFIERMKKEGRLQEDSNGESILWLSPSHPKNRKLLLDVCTEVLKTYPVDGLHLDYIRYPNSTAGFSPTSKEAFQKWLGKDPVHWPKSVQPGGPLQHAFQTFRTHEISSFVHELYDLVKQMRPEVQLSAAVLKEYPECIHTVGQDWGQWIKKGIIDFVCPMNYTQEPMEFSNYVDKHVHLPKAQHRIIPGIGVHSNQSTLNAEQVIEQIMVTRKSGSNGFILFDLNPTLRDEILPVLSKGTTRPVRKEGY